MNLNIFNIFIGSNGIVTIGLILHAAGHNQKYFSLIVTKKNKILNYLSSSSTV